MVKRTILTLLILLVAIFTSKLYYAWKNKIWDGEARITIALVSQNPKIYSLDPISQKLTILELPNSLEIDTSHGLGNWFVGSLYELGLQKGMKGELFRTSLQKSLGVPIDAWVTSSSDVFFQDRPLAKITPLLQTFLPTSNVSTNLNFIDQLNLLIKTSEGRITRKEINPLTIGIIRKKDLAFKEEAYELTSERASLAFTKNFRDELVFSEGKTISIINTTSRAKLAQEVSQVVSTLGVKVVQTRQSSQIIEYCTLRGSPEELASNSAKRLNRLFKCKKETSAPQEPANLELSLGEDFAQEF